MLKMRLDATLVHLFAVGCPYPILALGSRRPFLSLGLAVEGGDISDRQAGKVGEQPPFLTVCRWNGIERDLPHLSTRTGHAAVSISLLRSSLIPLNGFQGFRISNSNVVDRESEWRTVFLLDGRRAGRAVCVASRPGDAAGPARKLSPRPRHRAGVTRPHEFVFTKNQAAVLRPIAKAYAGSCTGGVACRVAVLGGTIRGATGQSIRDFT
jgi:hypothetical protein